MASASCSHALSLPRSGAQATRTRPPLLSRRHLSRAVGFPVPDSKTKKGFRARAAPLRSRVLCLRGNDPAPVTGDSWEKSILKSEIPVLVEFHARWCGPCRMVHRVIDEIAYEYPGRLKCFILDTDSDFKLAEEYGIKSVPVVLIFKNGEKLDTIVGTMPKKFYVAAIDKALAS